MGIGISGTGLVTSTGRYPNIRWDRVSAAMTCGNTWANALQTGVYSFQNDMYNAKGPVSTLAKYVSVGFSTDGTLRYKDLYHTGLANVTASQHHAKSHGSDHTGDAETWNSAFIVNGAEPYDLHEYSTDNNLYATLTDGIYRSTDGTTWTKVSNKVLEGHFTEDGVYLYCGGKDGAIYRTVLGFTWTEHTTGTAGQHVKALFSSGGQLRRLISNGDFDRWYIPTAEWINIGTYDEEPECVIVWGGDDYIGTSNSGNAKIYRKTNGDIGDVVLETGTSIVSCFGEFQSFLYAGTGNDGKIFRTSDGINWKHVATPVADSTVKDLYEYEGYLWAAIDAAGAARLYKSADGVLWRLMYTADSDISFLAPMIEFGDVLYAFAKSSTGDPYSTYWYTHDLGTTDYEASTAKTGLMPTDYAWRVDTAASQGTKNQWSVSNYYVGDGIGGLKVSIGFQPDYVCIRQCEDESKTEVIAGATFAIRHRYAAAADRHTRPKATDIIKIYNYGFSVYAAQGTNLGNATYYYVAIKET
jgi:hypothetical protein